MRSTFLLPLAMLPLAVLPLAVLPALSPALAQPAEVEAGRGAFQTACAVCHGVRPGERRIGPSMAGVVGRPIASVPGFAYSPAMASAGNRWDKARLDAFLAAPQRLIPGTRMIYPGMADAAKRKAVIAYLATLSGK